MNDENWDDEPVGVSKQSSYSSNSWGTQDGFSSNSFNSNSPRGRGRGSRGFSRGRGRGRGRGFGDSGAFNSFGSNRTETRESGDSTDDSESMTVPKSYIGRLIGRGGSRKRDIEDQTGARLFIEEHDGEGLVKISGSESARAKAKEVVDDIVR